MYYVDGRGNILHMRNAAYAEKVPQYYAVRKVLNFTEWITAYAVKGEWGIFYTLIYRGIHPQRSNKVVLPNQLLVNQILTALIA